MTIMPINRSFKSHLSCHRTSRYPLFSLLLMFSLLGCSADSLARNHLDRDEVMRLVVEEANAQGIDPALALAIAQVESDFNPTVVSHKGARGVMQIMPKTGLEEFGINPALLFDPRTNIRTGITFIKQLTQRYGREDIALSHYNGGSAVRRPNGELKVISYTRGYVNKVQDKAAIYRATSPLLLSDVSVGTSYRKMQKRAKQLQKLRQKNLRLSKIVSTSVDPYLNNYQAAVPMIRSNSINKRQQVLQWESVYSK